VNQPECQVLESESSVSIFPRTDIFKCRVILSVRDLMEKPEEKRPL